MDVRTAGALTKTTESGFIRLAHAEPDEQHISQYKSLGGRFVDGHWLFPESKDKAVKKVLELQAKAAKAPAKTAEAK